MISDSPDTSGVLATLAAFETRAAAATAAGATAFERLLRLAECGASGQVSRVARFIAATFDGQAHPFDPFELRAVDAAISDDMLTCLDALRWARADLHCLVPQGHARVTAVIERFGWASQPRTEPPRDRVADPGMDLGQRRSQPG